LIEIGQRWVNKTEENFADRNSGEGENGFGVKVGLHRTSLLNWGNLSVILIGPWERNLRGHGIDTSPYMSMASVDSNSSALGYIKRSFPILPGRSIHERRTRRWFEYL